MTHIIQFWKVILQTEWTLPKALINLDSSAETRIHQQENEESQEEWINQMCSDLDEAMAANNNMAFYELRTLTGSKQCQAVD